MFKATGLTGVSDPDDSEDVDEGDILEEELVKPNGRPIAEAELVALVDTKLCEACAALMFCAALTAFCAAIKLAPSVR